LKKVREVERKLVCALDDCKSTVYDAIDSGFVLSAMR